MMVDMYKPYISGVTNHVEIYSDELSKLGHEVKIFTFGQSKDYGLSESVIYSKGLPIKFPFADLAFNINLNHTKQAIDLIQTMDIINVHHPFLSGSLAYRYCKKKKIPIIFTSHTRYDLYAEIYAPFLPKRIIKTFLKFNLQLACRKFNAIITPSQSSRNMYDELGIKGNFIQVPNGIRIPDSVTSNPKKDREKYGVADGEFIFIYVGRVGPEKNLPLMIDAFYSLTQSNSKIKLFVVGKGTELPNIIKQAEELGINQQVVFTGFIPYDEVFNILKIADAFISLSLTEVHPLSILEAMSVGLPVIGIDTSGIKDIIENGQTGLLSNLSLGEIVKNMQFLIENPHEKKQIGENAKKNSKKYDVKVTSKMLISVFHNMLE